MCIKNNYDFPTEKDLRNQMEKEAYSNVLYRLMLEEIANLEEIVITDEEANKESEELAKKYNMDKEDFLKEFGGIEMIKYDLEMRRTVEKLKELINSKFKVSQKDLDEFLKDFPFNLVYSPTNVENKLFEIRDKDDYIILHTAIIEDVDVFITGDKDFDNIDIDKPEIMNATEFLEKYS